VGVPFWELPYGYYNFQKLCLAEAKLLKFDEVLPQDEICVENLDSVLYSELIKNQFSRIEVLRTTDDGQRDKSSGRVFLTKREDARSQYCLRFVGNISQPWRIVRHDQLIERVRDNHLVARQSRFHWAGMWWQQLAAPILGRGGRCFDDPYRSIRFVRTGSA
jgi:hypothetical protein